MRRQSWPALALKNSCSMSVSWDGMGWDGDRLLSRAMSIADYIGLFPPSRVLPSSPADPDVPPLRYAGSAFEQAESRFPVDSLLFR